MTTATANRHRASVTRTVRDPRPRRCTEHTVAFRAGCPICQEQAAWYKRRRTRSQSNGTWQRMQPVAPIAAHVAELMQAGWTLGQIEERSGISKGMISEIHCQKRTRGVAPVTAEALLGVTGPAPEGRFVLAVGTHRRLRALGAIGWPRPTLAARLGISAKVLDGFMCHEVITVATRDRVKRLYDELSTTPGPSELARARARGLGNPSPLAWDDDTIDDPAAEPDLGGQADRNTVLLENSDEIVEQGHTFEQAAERLGVSVNYLHQARSRARKTAA